MKFLLALTVTAVSYTHLDVYKRQVEYDPEQVSLDALLLAYFYVIDPTVQNRQGNDRGSQYQTGVYFTNENARETVKRIAEIERGRSEKFFVEIGPLKNYYPAEEYHQNYLCLLYTSRCV